MFLQTTKLNNEKQMQMFYLRSPLSVVASCSRSSHYLIAALPQGCLRAVITSALSLAPALY